MIWRFFWGLLAPFRRRTRRDPRQTFEFWDGARDRSVDPVEAWGSLTRDLGEDLADALRTVTSPAPPGLVGEAAARFAAARMAAAERVAAAVCRAFGVEPYADGVGLTQTERVALAAGYVRHMSALGAVARP